MPTPARCKAARQKRNEAGADGSGLDDADLLEVQEVTPRVSVLVRDPEQVRAVCAFASHSDLVDEIVLDFLEMTNYQASIDVVREHGLEDLRASGQDGFVALELSASTVKLHVSELRVFKEGAKIFTEFTVGYFELK